jgi:hypothetical protein
MKYPNLTLIGLLLAGCNGNTETKTINTTNEKGACVPLEISTQRGIFNFVSVTYIQTHEYLVVETSGSLSVCHSGSCWCNPNQIKK